MNNALKNSDTGLWFRGMVLFIVMAGIAGVVLFMILRRPTGELVENERQPEQLVSLITAPQAIFPANISWGALHEFIEHSPSSKGWQIRYNANIVLGRRGSEHFRLDLLREMLNEKKQTINFRIPVKDGKHINDDAAAQRTVLGALEALVEWHKKTQSHKKNSLENAQFAGVLSAVQSLTRSENSLVQSKAKDTVQKLNQAG